MYDQISQLKSATNSFVANETYGYDANGNRNTAGYIVGIDNRTTASPADRYYSPAFTYTYDAKVLAQNGTNWDSWDNQYGTYPLSMAVINTLINRLGE